MQICQTRYTNIPNQANTTRPTGKKNPVILSTPVSDKGIGHTYNQEKQTRSQNTEAEHSIIGCETVKIRARTPFGFNDLKHRGISLRIILVNEMAQKISLPLSNLGIHCASKAIPCTNKHEKCLETPTGGP